MKFLKIINEKRIDLSEVTIDVEYFEYLCRFNNHNRKHREALKKILELYAEVNDINDYKWRNVTEVGRIISDLMDNGKYY